MSEQHFIDKCLLSVCGQLYFILSEDKKITSIMSLFSCEGRLTVGGLKVSVCIDIIVQGCDIRKRKC